MGASSSTRGNFEHFSRKFQPTLCRLRIDENLFLSPASIALALSMCAVGARHETLKQMLDVLGFRSIEGLIKTSEQVLNAFSVVSQDRSIQIKLANRLYVQKSYQVERDYLELIQKSFSSDVQFEDFKIELTRTTSKINAWVEQQTDQLVNRTLLPDDIPKDAGLIVISCVYFKGTWESKFNEELTDYNATFYETNGTTSKVTLMHQREKFLYARDKSLRAQIVHIPYKHNSKDVQLVFTIILPKAAAPIHRLEKKFTSRPQLLQNALKLENTKSRDLLLHVPKFKIESTFELKSILQRLRMKYPFDQNIANFTGIVDTQDAGSRLLIDKVIHKAVIDVNEQGTDSDAVRAFPASEAITFEGPWKKHTTVFRANRPFLFYIREVRQNVTLFAGKFGNSEILSS
ncbi:unnamed protein product [Adineta ricciae]|uniref:Serpin domain-containing protein n=1 Tax=Adineta ricciae TaxID=249248 RepID=A0A813TKT6_ADIRI|nr:unnamed protein product [Adineta ricciae]